MLSLYILCMTNITLNSLRLIQHIHAGCLATIRACHAFIYTHSCVCAHTHCSCQTWQRRHILSDRKYFPAPWWSPSVTAKTFSSPLMHTQSQPKCAMPPLYGSWLSLQLPWRHRAEARALKASCIISRCVDTLAFSFILSESEAFSAQSSRRKVTTVQYRQMNTRGCDHNGLRAKLCH